MRGLLEVWIQDFLNVGDNMGQCLVSLVSQLKNFIFPEITGPPEESHLTLNTLNYRRIL